MKMPKITLRGHGRPRPRGSHCHRQMGMDIWTGTGNNKGGQEGVKQREYIWTEERFPAHLLAAMFQASADNLVGKSQIHWRCNFIIRHKTRLTNRFFREVVEKHGPKKRIRCERIKPRKCSNYAKKQQGSKEYPEVEVKKGDLFQHQRHQLLEHHPSPRLGKHRFSVAKFVVCYSKRFPENSAS